MLVKLNVSIDKNLCRGSGICEKCCPQSAIKIVKFNEENSYQNQKIDEIKYRINNIKKGINNLTFHLKNIS